MKPTKIASIYCSILAIIVILACCVLATSPQSASAYWPGQWNTITVTNATATSSYFDLGDDYFYLNMYVPTITAGTVSIQVSDSADGTYAADNQTGTSLTSSTGGYYTTLTLGGYRFIKIITGATQTGGDATFKIRGFRPN